MAKKNTQKQNDDKVIVKKDVWHTFTKKFTPEQLEERKQTLSSLLMEKFTHEQTAIKAKAAAKNLERKIDNTNEEISEGGEEFSEDCEVKIYPDTKKKEYYFEGELVDTEEIDEEDLQMEIEELEEEGEEV